MGHMDRGAEKERIHKVCFINIGTMEVGTALLFFFLAPHLLHVKIPGPGIEPAPQQQPKLLQ